MEPSEVNRQSMWSPMEKLFPIHRTLIGEGFTWSPELVGKRIPLEIHRFPSGTKCFDWTIPKGFRVHEAYVEAPDGSRPLDFARCNHHVWNYCQPFLGTMSREELVSHISTHPELPDAVPLRVSYYREKFGLCASQHQVAALPPGPYKIVVDTEIYDDELNIGEGFLPGERDEEILVTSYLCHPMGANDNQPGVAVTVELFRLLAQLPQRHYSYRLVIWPETIGAITYIANFPERIGKVVGGLVSLCVGDDDPFHYKKTFSGDGLIDRAVLHALEHSGHPYEVRDYHQHRGSDERQFNPPGLRAPMGSLVRTPPGELPQYHSSADDLEFVTPDALLGSLEVYWKALMTIEKTRVYAPNFVTEPFLTGHGVYPFDQGGGEGRAGTEISDAYYHLMGGADGKTDLLAIADRSGQDIDTFDRAVADMERVGLIRAVG